VLILSLIDDSIREIISKKEKVVIGEPVLTRYERARVVGARALQVSQGAPVLIDVESDDFRPIEVAKLELKARVLPVGMARRIPNGQYQILPIQWLKDREFISQIKIDAGE
jgi:DNA-directed RNA polymerase I, II, and III subunit RPABC2